MLGVAMRLAVILALMLLTSGADAKGGAGSVVLDIIGSVAENTRISSPGSGSVELEIVGSRTNNTTITSDISRQVVCFNCSREEPRRFVARIGAPWERQHIGVDAWYGTFWYKDIHMPRWPTP